MSYISDRMAVNGTNMNRIAVMVVIHALLFFQLSLMTEGRCLG